MFPSNVSKSTSSDSLKDILTSSYNGKDKLKSELTRSKTVSGLKGSRRKSEYKLDELAAVAYLE
jgi:hypothetical protein